MDAWRVAAPVVVLATNALIIASPSWMARDCNAIGGADCGTVSAFLVGFLGALVAGSLLLVGALRRD